MTEGQFKSDELGEIINGILDVLLAFSLALEARGVLSRAEIAAMLGAIRQQAEAQQGPSKRTLIAELMQAVFDLPQGGADARSRLRLVDGGA